LAREGRKLAAKLRENNARVRDRSRSMGRKLRAISRTIRRRSGEAKAEVLALTQQTGELLARSVKEARRLAATARRKARGRGARTKLRAAAKLDELADRCEKVAKQIKQRVAGEKITDRLISLSDPDASTLTAVSIAAAHWQIRKGKLGKPNEFGYVAQIAEVNPQHQARRARTEPAGGVAARQPRRERATTADRDRAGAARALAKGDRVGRRLHHRPDHRASRRPRPRAGLHLRAPTARLPAHPTQAAA
jgi:IS5 family transposase